MKKLIFLALCVIIPTSLNSKRLVLSDETVIFDETPQQEVDKDIKNPKKGTLAHESVPAHVQQFNFEGWGALSGSRGGGL